VQLDLIRRRVVIHGRVQGVFFRHSTRERALARGVSGWVRNLPDGAVEAVLEGPLDAVGYLVHFCETGPGHAYVRHIDVHAEPPEGLTGFAIR
jgi:acylphosphatase